MPGYIGNISAQGTNLRFSHITVDNGLSQNTIHGIVKDKHGFMWFGTWEGVNRFDGYNFKIFRANENDTISLSNNRVNNIFKDSAENIWVVTGDQIINRYNYETENFTRLAYTQVPEYIINGLSIRNNSIRNAQNTSYRWRVLSTGLLQINKITGTELLYTSEPFNNSSLNDNALTGLYLDNNGLLWVGTENGGINKADINAKPFKNYTQTPFSENTLAGNIIRAICEDKSGNIWVGTLNKGVTKIDVKNNRYTHFIKNPDNSNSLIDNNIRSLYADKAGNIWIGTKNGLSRYNPITNNFTNYAPDLKNAIPHKWVFWITEDHNNHLWIGTFNGIAKYNQTTGSFLAYSPDSMLNSKNVRVILEDSKYRFWVATEGGGVTLLKRDSTTGFAEKITPLKHFLFSANDTNSIINNMVLAITEDETGMIWIGTNNGLCRLNPENFSIKRFNINTGLPDNLIMGALNDRNGHIWISHKKGISRLNIHNFNIRTFTKQDGLPGNEFTQNAFHRNKENGQMYFGGTNGFCTFHPDSIIDNPFYPPVVLTSIKVLNQTLQINKPLNNHVILKKSLLYTKEITLFYGEKTLAIEFAALHYSNPPGNKYKYKLEGFDINWIETDGNNRIATYSNLDPQKYIFKVMASNCDGIWNPVPTELLINVLPPWWRTWWAKTLYMVIVLLLLYISYRLLVFRIKMKNQLAIERLKAEREHEINQVKLSFFTHISHEFRTPLSLIIDPLLKLKNGETDPLKTKNIYNLMYRNAQRLLELINQILDFRKTESGNTKLELFKADIISYTEQLTDLFRYEAEQRNIEFNFESAISSLIIAFDPDKIKKIVTNIISNAFKYTEDSGKIAITIIKPSEINLNNYIQIDIADSGIGIPKEELDKIFDPFYHANYHKPIKGESVGLGLTLAKLLTELHKGQITVTSIAGKGSCFSVLIPVNLTTDNEISSGSLASKLIRENDITVNEITNQNETKNIDSDKPLLLIVEDNNDIRTYLTNELNDDFTILQAKNGKEGYTIATDSIPDIIISDVMMPVMDGFEFCKLLKTDEKTSHIPVILLTARQSDQYKIEGLNIGADAYITKPFNTNILKAQLKNLIESRQKLRNLFAKENIYDLKAIAINITDEAFLNKTIDIIKKNLDKTEFSPDTLASALNMSLRQLYRKIKALTDITVHDFIVSIKLNHACELLLSGEFNIAEVAYKTGFTEPANFTRSFTKKYGKSPSAFIKEFNKI